MYDRKRIIHDVPYLPWIIAIGLIGFGVYRYTVNPNSWIMPLVVVAIGLVVVLILSILNVYVDQNRMVLEIERRSILGRKRIEVQIDKVQRVFVDRRVGTDSDGDRSVTYQVVLILDTGERVPLRKSYSSGKKKYHKFAEIIASEIGIDQVDSAPESMGEMMAMAFQMAPVEDQAAQTGIDPGVHESNGVQWQLETFNFGNTGQEAPVYRWSSTDVSTHNDFVFIVQKMEGVGEQRGLMKLAGNFLFKTSLKLHGFDESYTPGLDQAKLITDVDKRLVDNFFVFTNNPGLVKQMLNPWMVMPMVGWEERYEIHRGDKEFKQLSVLFSPLGLYVSLIGKLDQAEIDQLIGLGVELVRAKQ